jgi:NAD-dependent DNA ligase
VVGTDAGSKAEKAAELEIKMLDEDQLLTMLEALAARSYSSS